MIKPEPDTVARYGEPYASQFAQVRNAMLRLVEAFDMYASRVDCVQDAGEVAEAYTLCLQLLDTEHSQILSAFEANKNQTAPGNGEICAEVAPEGTRASSCVRSHGHSGSHSDGLNKWESE